ncbi:periplasmic chaperone for outer membrane proteins Skp [Lutibacter oricola]|uniref:Periplasmic chaperone for outer membrane proteins Skp n=1 Tax=Lutibacter oricola TaxID=762486 RepID=A0A1H2TH99_9FLAO|nr:OmpH family outer membrane protein [Lutibacter oricola]SDW43343.1 periplasmic chaperone for outer membrane proteins Skp [Lutibacter oricola]
MTKKVLLITIVLILGFAVNAQKAQRIGYIDMDYILENIPEYTEAQAKINAKGITWQSNIEKQQKEIDGLIAELENEKALLTKDLIAEKEEDIQIKELELKKLQSAYFGTKGDIYFLRQQLVQPIQDLVFNAVQDIAKKRKYDFVLDKSSDLIMLYTNKSFDISDLVINSITRAKKTNEIKSKQDKRKADIEAKKNKVVVPNEALQKKVSDREAKQLELKKKIEEKKAAQIKKREELKKAIEAKRLKRIKEIEDAKAAKLKRAQEIEEQKKEEQ